MSIISLHDLVIPIPSGNVGKPQKPLVNLVIESRQVLHIICNDFSLRAKFNCIIQGDLNLIGENQGKARFMGQKLTLGKSYIDRTNIKVHRILGDQYTKNHKITDSLPSNTQSLDNFLDINPKLANLWKQELDQKNLSSFKKDLIFALVTNPALVILDRLEVFSPSEREDLVNFASKLNQFTETSFLVWHCFLKTKPARGIVYQLSSAGLRLKILET